MEFDNHTAIKQVLRQIANFNDSAYLDLFEIVLPWTTNTATPEDMQSNIADNVRVTRFSGQPILTASKT